MPCHVAWNGFAAGAAVLFLRPGSFEDRIVVGVFWLSLGQWNASSTNSRVFIGIRT
jgi:hypothetical protein